MRPARLALWLGLTVLAALFATVVWPTPYLYVPTGDVEGGQTTARINRFTGETWMIFDGAWVPVGVPEWPLEPEPGVDV